jgi:hypothetical protein
MYDSPGSLQEVCVGYICENLESLCDIASSSLTTSGLEPSPEASSYEEQRQTSKLSSNGVKLVFKDSEIFLPSEIAEQLLTALSAKKKLSDCTMNLFDVSTTRLR